MAHGGWRQKTDHKDCHGALGMEEAMTTVQTADLWAAIDALDALPETHSTDWYKRLVEAAEAATQAELIAKGHIDTH